MKSQGWWRAHRLSLQTARDLRRSAEAVGMDNVSRTTKVDRKKGKIYDQADIIWGTRLYGAGRDL